MAFYCIVTGINRVPSVKRGYSISVEFDLRDDADADVVEGGAFEVPVTSDMQMSDIRQAIREEFRARVRSATEAQDAVTRAGSIIGFRFPAAP